jgi:hypothetical protein
MQGMFDSGSFVNPFKVSDLPGELVNFATGVVAPADIQAGLVGALNKGEALAEKFVQERLMVKEGQQTPSKSFYDTMSRANIKTMADMNKVVKIRSKLV